jgi:hypothetical protein
MSEWCVAGSGGFRDVFPLIAFGIACPSVEAARRAEDQDVRLKTSLSVARAAGPNIDIHA